MLIDAHIHISTNQFFSRRNWDEVGLEQKREGLKEVFKQYKDNHIVALRDGGDALFASRLAREVAREEGILYKSPVYAFYKKGYYGDFLGKPLEGLEDFKKEAPILLKYRPDHLKIILTEIVNFEKYGDVGATAFSLEELKYMTAWAKDNGLPVMVHANGCEGVGRAIQAGVTTVEHGYLSSRAELYGMAEKGIIWVPTLAPLGNIVVSKDPRFEREMDVIRRVYEEQAANVREAVEMGLRVALGSDAGAYRVGQVTGLLDELEHFERAGLKRPEIEKMCLENGAAALGVSPGEIAAISGSKD